MNFTKNRSPIGPGFPVTKLENKAGGRAHFLAMRRQHAEHPLEQVGEKLRAMMPWLHNNDQND